LGLKNDFRSRETKNKSLELPQGVDLEIPVIIAECMSLDFSLDSILVFNPCNDQKIKNKTKTNTEQMHLHPGSY
jgi:hypothetical protein